jgi:drug/metabolite transporter (DMT)-like permease
MSHPHWRGVFLVTLSGLLFGCMGFLGTRLLENNLSIENMLFWRFAVATLWIAASFFYVMRKKKSRHAKPVMKTFVLNALTYSGGSAFYFLGARHIGTGLAMVIFFSFPVFVALLEWIFGTWKMNLIAFAALLSVVAGLFLLKGNGNAILDATGIIFAMLGGFCFAAYIYCNQHASKSQDSQLLTLSVCIGNTFIFFVWSCYSHSFVIPSMLSVWFYICAIGIVSTALPIQLLLNGLKYLSPVKASILSVLEPVVTLLIGFVLLNESMTFMQLLGVMIVLSGAILIQFEGKRE